MIDFKAWAKDLTQQEIEKALRQAYLLGYDLGLNYGWAIEREKGIENNLV